MNDTKEILKNQFKKLPKDIQDAILAVDLGSKMQVITKKNNLHIDQAEILENETVFVLLGLEHPSDLVANIAKHVDVSEEKAEAITEDLNRDIFLKIRESLKKIFEEKNETARETEEELNRGEILREIEDKEHPNILALGNMSELHLEARPPSEIVKKNINLSGEQVAFQKTEEDIKKEKPTEINFRPEQVQKQPSAPQTEAIKTMTSDIFKDKMSGKVNIPKETIEINDPVPSLQKTPSETGKIDPYRERIEE